MSCKRSSFMNFRAPRVPLESREAAVYLSPGREPWVRRPSPLPASAGHPSRARSGEGQREGESVVIPRLRRCEKITAPRPRRLGRLICGKPSAFRQAPQHKCFSVKPEVRKGRAFPPIGRQSRDFFTPSTAVVWWFSGYMQPHKVTKESRERQTMRMGEEGKACSAWRLPEARQSAWATSPAVANTVS